MRKLRKMAIGVLSILLVTVSMGSTVTATVEKERKLAKPIAMIAIGEKIEGNLTGTGQSDKSPFYDHYYLENNNECTKVSITLKSDAFDAYMYIYRQVGEEKVYVGKNDDDGVSLHSAFEMNVEKGELFAIRASSYNAGKTGAFSLEVKSLGDCPSTVDLFLTDIKVSPKVPAIGQLVTFTAKLNVKGTLPLAEREEIDFDFYLSENQDMDNPKSENKINRLKLSSLKKGWKDGDILVQTGYARSIWETGDNFISAVIDTDNKIYEIDESNNWLKTGKKLSVVDPVDDFVLTTEINNGELFVSGDKLPIKNVVEYLGISNRWVDLSFEAENVYEKYTVYWDWDNKFRFKMDDKNPYEEKSAEIGIGHLDDGLWKIKVKSNRVTIPEREFYFYKGGWNWW
ncbi:MAG: hypothetical protein FE834_07170 [Gammaproteobacteria bacterium]|nr:hypothetical protein [Gammaproteobacteria bacterium]